MKQQNIVIAFIIISLMAGCASQSPVTSNSTPITPTPAPTLESTTPVEISVGAANLITENLEWRKLLESQVALFEASHPNIKINLVPWGWDAKAFPEQLAAGEVPDLMEVAATEGALVIDERYAADLTSLWQEWQFSQDFNEQILSAFARDNRIYGVPVNIYIMGLFYDKTLFKSVGLVDQNGEAVPPTNWEEFIASAQTIKENTSAAGFCILTQSNQGGWNFVNWGWQAGGEFEQQVDGKWKAVFDEAPIVEAMTFIQQLRWEHNVLQDNLILDASELLEKLPKHECGMAMIAPDWFQAIAPDGNFDDYGLTKLPTGPAGDANLMGGAYQIIKADLTPEEQKAAFEWITWFSFNLEALENDLQADVGRNHWTFLNRSLMYKPNSQISIQERELIDKYRGLPYFRDYIEAAGRNARIEPPIAVQELYSVLDGVLWEVLNNENADPQALLTDAAEKFQVEYLNSQ